MSTFHVPVLFDISNATVQLLGESFDADSDPIISHLEFTLQTAANSQSAAANSATNGNLGKVDIAAADFKNVFLVGGDQDNGDEEAPIFFVKKSNDTEDNAHATKLIDDFCTKLSSAILYNDLQQVAGTKTIPLGGSDENGDFGTSVTGARGESLGTTLGRVASTHLVGNPLAQVIFTDENDNDGDIQAEDEKGDSNYLGTAYGHNTGTTKAPNTIAKQLSIIFGGSQAAADDKIKITDPASSAAGVYNSDNNNALVANQDTGVQNDILKSLLEQLLADGRANELTGYDVSGGDTMYAGPLPFKATDKIVIYVRPILEMKMNGTVYTPSLISIPGDGTPDDGNDNINLATVNQLGVDDSTLFKNAHYEWVSKGGTLDGDNFTAGAAGTFGASGTNLVSPNATTALFDGHIWKISIELTA